MKIIIDVSKKIMLLVHFVLIANNIQAQSVDIIETDPDNGRNSAFYLGPIGVGGLKLVGFDHYQPTKFFASIQIGPTNYAIDGNYFLVNFTKDIVKSQVVKTEYRAKYYAKIPSVQRLSLGLHLNVNHLNQLNNQEVSSNYGSYRTTEISPGITWLTARNQKLQVKGDPMIQGSSYRRFNLDATFYTFRSINESKYSTIYFTQKGSTVDTTISIKSINEVLNKVGYKFYIDGKATTSGQGRISFKYLIGIQSSPLKLDGLRPKIMGGVGVGYSFHLKKKPNNATRAVN